MPTNESSYRGTPSPSTAIRDSAEVRTSATDSDSASAADRNESGP